MDKELILRKIESLRRCLDRIESRTPPDLATLRADLDTQDILVLNLERAVQICVDIGSHMLAHTRAPSPSTMAEVFRAMAAEGLLGQETAEGMAKAAGFRNIALHEYDSFDWAIVWSIITGEIAAFKDFGKAVLAGL